MQDEETLVRVKGNLMYATENIVRTEFVHRPADAWTRVASRYYTDAVGRKFRIEEHSDDDMGAPWEQDDALGHVSKWTTRSKRPHEFILNTDGKYKRFYDYRAAVERAHNAGLRGNAAIDAVIDDYRRIRAWCNNEWHYMGIVVIPLTDDGDEWRSRAIGTWGIESDTHSSRIFGITDELLREAGAELRRPRHQPEIQPGFTG